MKKKIPSLALAVLMIASLTACGSSNDVSSTTVTATEISDTSETSESAPTQQGHATLWDIESDEDGEAFLENLYTEWTVMDGYDNAPEVYLAEDGAVIGGETFTLHVVEFYGEEDYMHLYAVPDEDGIGYEMMVTPWNDGEYVLYLSSLNFDGGEAGSHNDDFGAPIYTTEKSEDTDAAEPESEEESTERAEFLDESGQYVRTFEYYEISGVYIGFRYDPETKEVSTIDIFGVTDPEGLDLDQLNSDEATLKATLDSILEDGAADTFGDSMQCKAYALSDYVCLEYTISIKWDDPDWCATVDDMLGVSLTSGYRTSNFVFSGISLMCDEVPADQLYPEGSLTPIE